ncbi:YdcF family protein [Candidatus Pelagibacter sp. Uisw_127]|uniref:YdcF family protein n=1 Tax=Candidatus Pelagibacter sp. Uisw_127 TaxID=3230988 RepID=UPI0039EA48F5
MDLYFYISKIATPLLIPSNILIVLLIIIFYFGFIRNKIFFRKFFTATFIIFSIISIFPVGHNLIFFFLEKNYYSLKLPKKIDYIFVPSGSLNRIIFAMNLMNNPNLKDVKIIYSSGIAYLDKNNSNDSETNITKNLILNSNISNDSIIFLSDARNTFENFKRLNDFLIKKNKIESKILLITDAYHMNRSVMMAKKFNLNISSLPSSYITKQDTVGLINSYQNIRIINNLGKFDLFIKELISISFSRFL